MVPRKVFGISTMEYLLAPLAGLSLFLESLAFQSSVQKNVKQYQWGSVEYREQRDGLHLSIRLHHRPAHHLPTHPATSVNGPFRQSSDANPEIPSHALFVLVPPSATVRIKISVLRQRPVRPDESFLVSGYEQLSDSSALIPLHRTISYAVTYLPATSLALDGYEWFRGHRLARLRISPFVADAQGLTAVESIEAILQIESGVIESYGVPQKTEDPHFERVLNSLILNWKGAGSVPTTSLPGIDTTGRWISFSQQYVKLGIPLDGIYRIRFVDLQQVGVSVGSIDPRSFRAFNRGKEIPLFVSGEEDGIFSSNEYIEFPALRNYGTRDYRDISTGNDEYAEYLNRYTDTSSSWLTWGGVRGARMSANVGVQASSDTLTWYTEMVHVEVNTMLQFIGGDVAVRQDPRWQSGDIWGWGWLGAGGSFQAQFAASNIHFGFPTAGVFARFASWGAQSVVPAHRVRLRVNNSDTLQALDVQQYQQVLMQGNVPVDQLTNGLNTIRVHSLPTSSTVNFILFDWADAEYPRQLVAVSDSLIFGFKNIVGRNVRTIRISGLTTQDVAIYKFAPSLKRITNAFFVGSSTFTVSFADTVSPGDRYMIFSSQKIRTPLLRNPKSFINLRDPARRADYILITHKRFLPVASVYVSFIGSQYNLKTTLIDVEDIFDEFGYGYPTAESIRDFLKATSLWQSPMPSYVVLAGDATYDYKHIMTDPNPANRPFNAVPSFGNPVSDPWLAVLDDASIIPQMYVGRIPVNSADELARYFQRHQSYVTAKNDDWNKRYIFFAGGDPGTQGQIESFKSVNEQIISTMVKPAPIGGMAANFYKTTNPQSDFGPSPSHEIRDAIDNGGVFINYIGHSGTQTWDNGIGDPGQLLNKRGRYALISDFGCSTAKFAEPNIKSFGELFTLGETGSAIAYVGNSALGFTSNAVSLPLLFYKQFLVHGEYGIGKAHLLSKIERMQEAGGPGALINRVMMLTNSLLGDPAIQLAVPKKPNLLVRSTDLRTIPESPSDDDGFVDLTIPYSNTGRVIPDTFTVSVQRTYAGSTIDTALRRALPLFRDTLMVRYAIKDMPGEYKHIVNFNREGRLAEIESSDNNAELRTVVLSSSFKLVQPAPGFEQPPADFILLNPSRQIDGGNNDVLLDIDTSRAFVGGLHLTRSLGQVVTRFPVQNLTVGRSYYWKAQFQNSTRPPSTGRISISTDGKTRWRQSDSLSWSQNTYRGVRYIYGSGAALDQIVTDIKVTSSGFVDGAFGAVELNGVNILANTFGRGHRVVVLDTLTLAVRSEKTFDLFANTSYADSLQNHLNALPQGSLVIELIIDEGGQSLHQGARDAIKSLGSIMIDSVGFRDSWAIIGRKGAKPGTVPELWKRTFKGRVVIDTTFIRNVQKGEILSPEIGPVGSWEEVSLTADVSPGTEIKTSVIGVSRNGKLDTLISKREGGLIPLTGISAREYPSIRLLAQFGANSQGISPTLKDWSVSLQPPAELAMNYQSVSLSADTVLEGTPVAINASIHNVGYQRADSVSISLTALVEGRGLFSIDSIIVPGIPQDSSISFSSSFTTAGKRGRTTLFLEVDPGHRVTELYRSNNIYSSPIFVATDTVRPTFDVTFDGARVFDGDYVSARPTIHINIFDNSPLSITDPSSVTLLLNDRKISLGSTPDSLFESGTGTTKARVTFRPELSSGTHLLVLKIKDASCNQADTSQYRTQFRVETESRLLDVFNFPNPFAGGTFFTFNLTGSRMPDDLSVKIYTVAGRLVRKLTLPGGELRFGFNRIHWDGRDDDGNELANGVYFYKIALRLDGSGDEVIQRLAKIR